MYIVQSLHTKIRWLRGAAIYHRTPKIVLDIRKRHVSVAHCTSTQDGQDGKVQ